jgi:hypothetical protein
MLATSVTPSFFRLAAATLNAHRIAVDDHVRHRSDLILRG